MNVFVQHTEHMHDYNGSTAVSVWVAAYIHHSTSVNAHRHCGCSHAVRCWSTRFNERPSWRPLSYRGTRRLLKWAHLYIYSKLSAYRMNLFVWLWGWSYQYGEKLGCTSLFISEYLPPEPNTPLSVWPFGKNCRKDPGLLSLVESAHHHHFFIITCDIPHKLYNIKVSVA